MPTLKLTKRTVDALKQTKRPYVAYDTDLRGFGVRVTSSGPSAWVVEYRPGAGGRQVAKKRHTFASLGELTPDQARDRAKDLFAAIRLGRDPAAEKQSKRKAAAASTFDRLADRYLEEHAKPNKSSWRNDEGYLRRPRERWGNSDPKTITRRDVIDLLDEIKMTAPVSANRTHSVLVTLFNWAVEDELLEVNPAVGLKKRAKETAKERALSDVELRVLWQALGEGTSVTIEVVDALQLLVLTGQRPGEVAGIVRNELVALVKPSEARWEIPASRMKARKAHVVPLAPMARALILEALARRERQGDREGVFASKVTGRTTVARHSLSQALARLIASLKAEGPDADAMLSLQQMPPTPHDLRRTVASGLSRIGGIPREDRKAVLAHVEGDVHGSVYDKYERLGEKRAALEKWERHLACILEEITLSTEAELVQLHGSRHA